MQMAKAQRYIRPERTRAMRIVIFVIALWQAGIAVAPHSVSFSAATSTRPHWHATGDSLELQHDETACPVCTLQQTARSTAQPIRLPVEAVAPIRFDATSKEPHAPDAFVLIYSRGPPLG
jgi:hypothetical protein